MKKMFLTVALVVGFVATSSSEEIIVNDCGPNATRITASCWTGCVSYTPGGGLTGSVQTDIENRTPRQLTQAQRQIAQGVANDFCSPENQSPYESPF